MEQLTTVVIVVTLGSVALLALKGRDGLALAGLAAGGFSVGLAITGMPSVTWLIPLGLAVLAAAVAALCCGARPGSWWFRNRYDQEKQDQVRHDHDARRPPRGPRHAGTGSQQERDRRARA